MVISTSGRAPWRVILIQVVVLLGLVAFYKLYLPHRERELATERTTARERAIQALFRSAVIEDSIQEVQVPLDGELVKRHPQRLRDDFSQQDAEAQLGVPDSATTDFRGGQHLRWLGTTHQLEASFNAGHLYCLQLQDRTTGHGAMVFDSFVAWHPY
jgi:hypothetical protein